MENKLRDDSKKLMGAGKIISTGIFVGLLDGIGAIINYLAKGGKHPEKIFNFISSGLFGKDGLTGGTTMVIWGVILHLLIALIWTLVFFFGYSRIEAMRRNWITTGVVYGIFIWVIMTRIVLPLSKTPSIPFKIDQALIGVLILILAIGLPLSCIAKRYFSKTIIA